VPNVKVFTAGKKMPLAVEGRGEFSWLLTTEEGISTKATPPAAKR
jgi:4-alpha-glucanotransferase